MQQYNPSYIELIYQTTSNRNINIYQKLSRRDVAQLNSDYKFEPPIGFIWHDSQLRPASPKLINWLQNDFKTIFQYDPIKWWASISTVSPHLQPYLKDLFNDKTIIH